MKIHPTEINGVYLIERVPFCDERGYFARVFCEKEMQSFGINCDFLQSNISQNIKKGTLRGMHSQKGEFAEDKLIACVRGKLFDVCVDVRKGSPTFGKYVGAELSENNGMMLYVPKGFAHGYLTLEDNTQALYMSTQFYNSDYEVGYSYKDPAFSIQWPTEILYISQKDSKWPAVAERTEEML